MENKITAIIVDDEVNSIQVLTHDLQDYPQISVVGSASSAQKAINLIIRQQPNVLFLDVEMPKYNGIELLQKIRPFIHSNMYVVFYTAFDKYLKEALRASAFDYLLKPYKRDELDFIVTRLISEIENNKVNFEQSMRRLLNNEHKFAIQTTTGLLLLKSSDIVYFEYENDVRSWVMTISSNTRHRLKSGTKADDIINISSSFIKVSQDCIINSEYVAFIENNSLKCVLYPPFNQKEIVVSRRLYSKVKETLEII